MRDNCNTTCNAYRLTMFLLEGTRTCKGGTRSEIKNCCSATRPCEVDEGQCETNSHCRENLRCSITPNCGSSFDQFNDLCCTGKLKPHLVFLYTYDY